MVRSHLHKRVKNAPCFVAIGLNIVDIKCNMIRSHVASLKLVKAMSGKNGCEMECRRQYMLNKVCTMVRSHGANILDTKCNMVRSHVA